MYYVITDGSCLGNPGPGGYCAIIKNNNEKDIVTGSVEHTTNQRMEIQAVIAGLQKVPKNQEVTVSTDSMYVIGTMTKGWKKRTNNDLWTQLDALVQQQASIQWLWVEGHSGHPDNEEANRLAQLEAANRKNKGVGYETA